MDELRTGREREEEKWESRGREVEELETELSKAEESVEFAAESKRVSVVVISSPPWDKSSKSSTKKSTASIYNISLLSLC